MYLVFLKVLDQNFLCLALVRGRIDTSCLVEFWNQQRFNYSQVSIKQASSLNYFEEIFHPARSY